MTVHAFPILRVGNLCYDYVAGKQYSKKKILAAYSGITTTVQ